MRIFGINEAMHFCSSFAGSLGDAKGSIVEFQKRHLGQQGRMIREGTSLFQEYVDCSLRDVERSLFLAASQYRRSLDLMIPSSSPWAHVTLYYGSWFASRALLGMFGCTVFRSVVIDVASSSPGRQALQLHGIGKRQGQMTTTYNGSHRQFWDFFYRAVGALRPMLGPRFAAVLAPVNRRPTWQIEQRNNLNYDCHAALRLSQDFSQGFSKERFPGSMPGALGTQYRILEGLVELAYAYAVQFGVSTDALSGLGQPGPLRDKVRQLIYGDKPPGLVRKTRKSALI